MTKDVHVFLLHTRGLVFQETVVLRRCGSKTQNFEFSVSSSSERMTKANARNVSFQSLYGADLLINSVDKSKVSCILVG